MAPKNPFAGLMGGVKKSAAIGEDVQHSVGSASTRDAIEDGATVIDLDPALIDNSFVTDRLVDVDAQFQELVEAIRVRGQDSPILVRPHPTREGRYQIAFGHRRARAARELGRPVRAVVKKLDDRDHVIAQGQENSARADLSFIERTMFADKLDKLGFDRETIMAALSVEKTTISKMLSVTKRIPADVLTAIGAARAIGRDRWHDLSVTFETEDVDDRAARVVATPEFEAAEPDKRFDILVASLGRANPTGRPVMPLPVEHWRSYDGEARAKIKNDGAQCTITLRAEQASAFGIYLASNLDGLYQAFEKAQRSRKA